MYSATTNCNCTFWNPPWTEVIRGEGAGWLPPHGCTIRSRAPAGVLLRHLTDCCWNPAGRSSLEGTVKLTKIWLLDAQDVGVGSRREPNILGIKGGASAQLDNADRPHVFYWRPGTTSPVLGSKNRKLSPRPPLKSNICVIGLAIASNEPCPIR